jgi:hypothetical protein
MPVFPLPVLDRRSVCTVLLMVPFGIMGGTCLERLLYRISLSSFQFTFPGRCDIFPEFRTRACFVLPMF